MAHKCTLSAECLSETPKAIRVRFEDGTTMWVPKSVIHDDSEVYESETDGSLVVADWFAEREGLE